MSSPAPACRTICVVAFGGDRSRQFVRAIQGALDAEKKGSGPGPTALDCLLYTGHTGVSTDGGTVIYGFHPDGSHAPTWHVLDRLKNGDAFPGVVHDDTAVFAAARQRGLVFLSFEVILPEPRFRTFQTTLDGERQKSQYFYGFPNGDGDCNCTTWLERLGLPMLTGRMDEFVGLPGIAGNPSRRFGRCL